MTDTAILKTDFEGLKLYKQGKVRDVYDLGKHLLIVATDRISAFDVVFPTGIPYKGAVLTALSAFWFNMFREKVRSHFVSWKKEEILKAYPGLIPLQSLLVGRSMLVEKAEVVPIECVARGYLAGSGWKEYQKTGSVCGIPLSKGLREADRLEVPIFTPATKEETGHDINISESEISSRIGAHLTQKLKEITLKIYASARDYAKSRGIIIADTKFEFGLKNNDILLVDEVLTPDSSRFWPVESYKVGESPVSYDKQFVRDYLEDCGWNKQPPAPPLPPEIVEKTSAKYLQALNQLTGKTLSELLEE